MYSLAYKNILFLGNRLHLVMGMVPKFGVGRIREAYDVILQDTL